MKAHVLLLLTLAAGVVPAAGLFSEEPAGVRVSATNPLPEVRRAETVEIPAARLGPRAGDLAKAGVFDAASGAEVLSQAVDLDGDGSPETIVLQADFGANETKAYRVGPAPRRAFRRDDFRVYGRFVRERFDDFAWENDRVAHRMYGAALESWTKEPLTSSGVDVWCKRTRRLVVNDWYLVDDYHRDSGEGADLYSVGKSRGCGGSGVFRDGRLHVSRNFRGTRVLANGPIRLVFELTYEPWDAAGARVGETKRVTLDAGSHLNRFESAYTAPVSWAAGVKKAAGADVRRDPAAGLLRTWEALKEGNGNLGCAVLVDPASTREGAEADGNALVVGKEAATASYLAGSAWDKGGDVPDRAAWDGLLDAAVRRARAPIRIEVEEPR